MATAKENAEKLYMEGIQNGKPREAVTRYTGEHYTQHSTGVADGVEGFIAFFEPFLERNPVREFKIVRALQDGPLVFLQVYQSLNNGESEWHTTDFFDSNENGKIVEHWDVISEVKPVNSSGHSQFDGATTPTDLEKTDENRQLVIDFIRICLIDRQTDLITDFISSDQYTQHNPDQGDGVQTFIDFYEKDDCPLTYQECFLTVAEGDMVATLNRASLDNQDLCQVDVFRVRDGYIVEHWDNSEPVPPKEEWANSGKF